MTSKYKLIICAMKNYNLHPREKFEPEPGFEPRTFRSLAQVVERQARDLEVRGLNRGPGSNFSLGFKQFYYYYYYYYHYYYYYYHYGISQYRQDRIKPFLFYQPLRVLQIRVSEPVHSACKQALPYGNICDPQPVSFSLSVDET